MLYVDDIMIIARNKTHIQKLKDQLKEEFDMEFLEEVKILGMEISRDRSTGKLWLSQENYVLKMLERFNIAEARPGHYSFSRLLQIILQSVSKLKKRGWYVSSTISECGEITDVCYDLH